MLFFSLFFTAATVMCFSVLPVSASQPKSSMEAERPSNISQSSFAGLGSRMSPNIEMLANVDQQVLRGVSPKPQCVVCGSDGTCTPCGL
ncbi:hypothetical protein Moror_10761 [Moniliophthora roreri MCA 2997]|uniref:Secreted protein n=1 Tax=Moniliophthora roreri (strain MCA 2997) TaxID=1381753 RepID=V2X2L9_MONRO|nr:hypothetical protein Moror_10761 [Moniliophthora roreri MCA 2997]